LIVDFLYLIFVLPLILKPLVPSLINAFTKVSTVAGLDAADFSTFHLSIPLVTILFTTSIGLDPYLQINLYLPCLFCVPSFLYLTTDQ